MVQKMKELEREEAQKQLVTFYLILEKEGWTTKNQWRNCQSQQECFVSYPAKKRKIKRRGWENCNFRERKSRKRSRNSCLTKKNQRWKIKINPKVKRITRKSIR